MTHANEYPKKKFIPFESDAEVKTSFYEQPTADREGIATVEQSSVKSTDEIVHTIGHATVIEAMAPETKGKQHYVYRGHDEQEAFGD